MSKLIKIIKKLCKCKCSCKTICDIEIKSPSSKSDTPPIQEQLEIPRTPQSSPRPSPRPNPRPLPHIPTNQNINEVGNVYVTLT